MRIPTPIPNSKTTTNGNNGNSVKLGVTLGDKLRLQFDQLKLQVAQAEVLPAAPPLAVIAPGVLRHRPEPAVKESVEPALDEAQLVGELLEWLFEREYLKPDVTERRFIQRDFFKSRG